MNDYAFTLSGADLQARPDGALWWPDRGVLCVSDLHLGKSGRIARRGGTLLPPYETTETLWRLAEAIAATNPAQVICLGDSFDDVQAADSLGDEARATLARLQAGRTWVWIEGNHDPGPVGLGGSHRNELTLGPLTFRHIAAPAAQAEVSGHYHPKAGVPGAGRRPCFVVDETRLLLPAFGAYTGGLTVADPAIRALVSSTARVILTGKRAQPIPMAACIKR